MTQKYQENEIKILDVNIPELVLALEKLGANKVLDGQRIFTTFDTKDGKYQSENTIIRLTEEDKLKLSVSNFPDKITKETVKLFVSRKEELIDLYAKLGIYPTSEVSSQEYLTNGAKLILISMSSQESHLL